MTLDDWQEALATEVMGHYSGWSGDYSGDEDDKKDMRADVDHAFAAARAHWQLGTVATMPDQALRELMLNELHKSSVAYWSAKAVGAEAFWNPSQESYKKFRDRHGNVEPFVASTRHDLRQMFAMYAFNLG